MSPETILFLNKIKSLKIEFEASKYDFRIFVLFSLIYDRTSVIVSRDTSEFPLVKLISHDTVTTYKSPPQSLLVIAV